jgi:GNAT superfamily N-acetyltransferase
MDPALLEAIERDAAADQLRAAPDELRARLQLGLASSDGALMLRLERVDLLQLNRVIGLGVSQPARRATLEAMIAGYRAAGLKRFGVQLAPDAAPPELREWLAALGLSVTSRWAKLWRDASPPLVHRLCPLRVSAVERADAELFGKVTCAAYGMPAPLAPWCASIVGRPGWRAYLAWDGGDAVAAASLRVDRESAWLGLDATLPSHRTRGAQSALIERRIKDAAAAGARLLVAETGEATGSFRNYTQAGFQLAYLRENFTLTQTASG